MTPAARPPARRRGTPRVTAAQLRSLQLPKTEAELQRLVAREARARGLAHYHARYSLGSEPGYPDSTIVGPGGLVVAELKGPRGRLSPDQMWWRDRFLESGTPWFLWTAGKACTEADVAQLTQVLDELARRPA